MSSKDPKRPNAIVAYHVPRAEQDEMDPDVPGTISMALGLFAMLVRQKLAGWGSLCFAIMSYMNQRVTESDENKGGWASLMFASSALLICYTPMIINLYLARTQATQQDSFGN
ncbi:uncharacterized protein VTP21DRAFT_6576 [Calcarisporiella thermophila]|uniref:uncharacterized protein n=1 Tax=Calcarisporiella thermophila TaxID=911321 RepID=UPI0037445A31